MRSTVEVAMPASGRPLNWTSLITILSAAILIGTELVGAAWAAGWAVAEFFLLGPTVAMILQGVFGVLALYCIFVFVRQAIKVEPIYREQ